MKLICKLSFILIMFIAMCAILYFDNKNYQFISVSILLVATNLIGYIEGLETGFEIFSKANNK